MVAESSRVVIVAGGSSGIGRAIAEAFTRRNERVVIIGRNEERLRETARGLGPNVEFHRVDVSQREQVQAAVNNIIERFRRVDVLVNAAGTGAIPRITTDIDLEEAEKRWDQEIDIHLKGCFLMAMATVPHLTRPGGRIINISSIAAFTGGRRRGAVGYASAKAGIHGLTYALARELSPQGITVNTIAPGFIANTGFTAEWPQERIQAIIAETPVGRAGTVDDIAAATVFLASPEASFITGQVIKVNGGWRYGW